MKLKADDKLLKSNHLRPARKINYFKIKLKPLNGIRKESRTSLLENIVNNSEIHDNGVLANSFPKKSKSDLNTSIESNLSLNTTPLNVHKANKSDTDVLQKKKLKNNKISIQNGDLLVLSNGKRKNGRKSKNASIESPIWNSCSFESNSDNISLKNDVINCSSSSLSKSNRKSNSKSIINNSNSFKTTPNRSSSRLKSKNVIEIDLTNDFECALPSVEVKEEIVDTSYDNTNISFAQAKIDDALHSTPIKKEIKEEVLEKSEEIDEKCKNIPALSPRKRRQLSEAKEIEDNLIENILKSQIKNRPKNLLKLISEKNSFLKTNHVVKPSSVESSVKIKEEPQESAAEDVEAKIKERFADLSKFKVGDLVWAQIGKFPHWPAIVFNDQQRGIYQRFYKKRHTLFIHVRFFGDKGRSSWIYLKNVSPYKSRNDMTIEIKSITTKMYYNQALDEIDSIRNLNNEQRIEAFLNLNPWLKNDFIETGDKSINDYGKRKRDSGVVGVVEAGKKMKLMEISLDQSGVDVKVEATDFEEELKPFIIHTNIKSEVKADKIENKEKKSKSKSKNKQIKVDLKIEPELETVKIELDSGNKENSTISSKKTKKSPKKVNPIQLIDETEENCFKRVLRDRSPKKEKKEESADENNDNEDKSVLLEDIKKENKIERKNSDAESKISEPGESLESQTELFKKYKPLRNISKEKVCEVCLKPEDVLQCIGKCKLYLHRNCATETAISGKITSLPAIKEKKIKKRRKKKPKNESSSSENKNKTVNESELSYNNLSLQEKIDLKMQEIMADSISVSESYPEIIEIFDSDSENSQLDESKIKNNNVLSSPNKNMSLDNSQSEFDLTSDLTDENFQCEICYKNENPECYVCQSFQNKYNNTDKKKCAYSGCIKYFHVDCLKIWPQTQWLKNDLFHCPAHVCHTCVSDNPRVSMPKLRGEIVRCIRCPATYHSTYFCLPAGAELLSTKQIICPRHAPVNGTLSTINTNWCFVCSEGGNLICCETCPTSVHADCFPIDYTDDGKYFCEECESGRFHLYDEVVWVKIGSFKWWPARIVFPFEVPPNVAKIGHNLGQFVVKFYGTHDYYWVNRGRTFLFQEGDSGDSGKNLAKQFQKAVEEATTAHLLRLEFKSNNDAKKKMSILPAPYVKINKNRPYGNVKVNDFNLSNITPCDCDPDDENPCGPDSNCLNRLLWTECHPEVCPAGKKCNNQRFQKREYPPLEHYKTEEKGWGLRSSTAIEKGQFIIEYVGELIDCDEYKRRLKQLERQNEQHFYFLTLNANIIIDAGPKGNLARFMNHSCAPNCETQKWTVNGETRVGLFATEFIPANTELTFNYNLECFDKKLKVCFCETSNCSGFIGLKSKPVTDKVKKSDKPSNKKKKNKKKSKKKLKK